MRLASKSANAEGAAFWTLMGDAELAGFGFTSEADRALLHRQFVGEKIAAATDSQATSKAIGCGAGCCICVPWLVSCLALLRLPWCRGVPQHRRF